MQKQFQWTANHSICWGKWVLSFGCSQALLYIAARISFWVASDNAISSSVLMFLLPSLAILCAGLLAGWLQWLAVKGHLLNIRAWLVATILGSLIGVSLTEARLPMIGEMAFFLMPFFFQWLVFRKECRKSAIWLLWGLAAFWAGIALTCIPFLFFPDQSAGFLMKVQNAFTTGNRLLQLPILFENNLDGKAPWGFDFLNANETLTANLQIISRSIFILVTSLISGAGFASILINPSNRIPASNYALKLTPTSPSHEDSENEFALQKIAEHLKGEIPQSARMLDRNNGLLISGLTAEEADRTLASDPVRQFLSCGSCTVERLEIPDERIIRLPRSSDESDLPARLLSSDFPFLLTATIALAYLLAYHLVDFLTAWLLDLVIDETIFSFVYIVFRFSGISFFYPNFFRTLALIIPLSNFIQRYLKSAGGLVFALLAALFGADLVSFQMLIDMQDPFASGMPFNPDLFNGLLQIRLAYALTFLVIMILPVGIKLKEISGKSMAWWWAGFPVILLIEAALMTFLSVSIAYILTAFLISSLIQHILAHPRPPQAPIPAPK